MNLKLFSVFLIFSFKVNNVSLKRGSQRVLLDDVEDLIKTFGFEGESHPVKTEDGYLIKVHRIKVSNSSSKPRLGPVFFMHGMSATAADFILTGPKIALPFLLSDNGYDVWLGNSRGNDHNLRHEGFSSASEAPMEYWNFSFHEIGFYDVAAMVDFILSETKTSKCFYVGHSQGTSSILALLATRPEYNKKIIQAYLLAPAAIMKNFPKTDLLLIGNAIDLFFKVQNQGFIEVANPKVKEIANSFVNNLCNKDSPTSNLCFDSYFYAVGWNKGKMEVDLNLFQNITRHTASQLSIKQIMHYWQLVRSGRFSQFDYQEENQNAYNTTEPPDYNLSNVKVPVYIYSGGCDAVTSSKDAKLLSKLLPNVRRYRMLENFNHCDFNYGKNSRSTFFEEILTSMNLE